MRRVLRQDPDVILLGEMRDLETISAAITAAETGHLVFGTLHTTGSARTVNRIIDAFPANQQEQIRAQLSVSLVAVISQVLMPAAGGKGRVAGFEVMINNPAIGNLIRKNETNKIQSTIQTSRAGHGTSTTPPALQKGQISRETDRPRRTTRIWVACEPRRGSRRRAWRTAPARARRSEETRADACRVRSSATNVVREGRREALGRRPTGGLIGQCQ
jgi:hypothetical protein